MLYTISDNKLVQCGETWHHKELEIEKLIVSTTNDENPILGEEIFGEELFYVDRQIINSDNKRSDIVALDKNGSVVIIELKKDEGKLGVEMQALQYVSNMSQYKGLHFVEEFCKKHKKEDIDQFLNEGVTLEEINARARIILVARYFDKALYSMGKWLCDQGISFKCIAYEPIVHENKKLLNFSTVFDQTAFSDQFRLQFSKQKREKGFYWHIIGSDNNEWWNYLRTKGLITTSFDCEPGDRGEEILKGYIIGDTILAYISKKGFVGYGIIEDLKYSLVEENGADDVFPQKGQHRHRKTIKWVCTVDIDNAIPASIFEKEYEVSHPIQTSSKIKKGRVQDLISRIKEINSRT
jgi:hypothetical protein